ncbi:hypothetical protein [Sphingomonas sanxanigenens]|uniref:Uncharacterized protein n=1 Tax=Sphingomonas sanxanigenens DSM 19645 = NX02 TaxID=1123269 RepID=W0A8P8_9SPHN|nr:hypothetical protein [Sphingomonas sanxanigenens]AHE52867.1 hypothetical protein NX02_05650 [Sphingomonas sanxanigenens DSM 19645 = NX02]
MANWRARRDVDLALRLAGLLLGGLAFHLSALLARHLHGHPAGCAGARDLLIATILFLSGSVGAALFFVGRHLLDEVRVSQRWARRT